MSPHFTTLDDSPARERALAATIAARLAAAIELRGRASLVVSGGRTPVGVFDLLSRQPLDWHAVTITLADERWVAPTHEDSNEHLVRSHLLRREAAAARFVPLKTAAATPEEGVAQAAAALSEIARPFDVVVLGMGSDGHTASLFPEASELPAALDPEAPLPCIAVRPPRAPYPRMTLTLRALLEARAILVEIAGADKRGVIERALLPGDEAEMPIRAVLRQRKVPVDIFWSP
jgi:6-phosphogluconolactonase